MNLLQNNRTGRRKFLKDILRLGTLGSLIFVGIDLGLRHNENKSIPSDCNLKPLCKGCIILSKCNLPKAQAMKETYVHKKDAQNKFSETRNERK